MHLHDASALLPLHMKLHMQKTTQRRKLNPKIAACNVGSNLTEQILCNLSHMSTSHLHLHVQKFYHNTSW